MTNGVKNVAVLKLLEVLHTAMTYIQILFEIVLVSDSKISSAFSLGGHP